MSLNNGAETMEVSMLEPDIVVAIRRLQGLGHGVRGIERILGINRKTVRRWLGGPVIRRQQRP